MATSARATMAIFLLVALSTSRTASSVVKRPGFNDDEAGCQLNGYLPGRSSGHCDKNNNPDCRADGQQYPQFLCSPPVSAAATWAVLTVNSFRKGRDGGYPSECDRAYHDDSEMVVALSTGMSRCGHIIRITARDVGTSVSAKVVDECDSVNGRDAEHNYEKINNIVSQDNNFIQIVR